MPITPDDLLTLAENILTARANSEVNYRNSATRSYYSIFHKCQPISDRIRAVPPKDIKGSHAKIFWKLKNHSDPAIARLGKLLFDGRAKRRHADYDLLRPFNKGDAEYLLGLASRVKTIVAQLPPNLSP
ncbi:MAG: hypothetical protein HQK85_06315 [Nitrospinae bacterium]|nr:hypothetical protein [Nitrospinota bacterium]